jgi:hypothetical protein
MEPVTKHRSHRFAIRFFFTPDSRDPALMAGTLKCIDNMTWQAPPRDASRGWGGLRLGTSVMFADRAIVNDGCERLRDNQMIITIQTCALASFVTQQQPHPPGPPQN